MHGNLNPKRGTSRTTARSIGIIDFIVDLYLHMIVLSCNNRRMKLFIINFARSMSPKVTTSKQQNNENHHSFYEITIFIIKE